jgi:SAM-dependent methyltransferase
MSVLFSLIKEMFFDRPLSRGNAAQLRAIDQDLQKVINHPGNSTPESDNPAAEKLLRERKVLNVGGNNKKIPIPAQYDGWEHVLLDIDPKGFPDVVCDARNLTGLPGDDYDSVYCSHNLEHYYRHDVEKVLAGFLHVLKDEGFAYIRVPDMGELMQIVSQRGLDIDDFLYQSPAGPISVRDVIYGYGEEIESSGCDFYAHKTGFTQKSLMAILHNAGFPFVFPRVGDLEISAIAFKNKPSDYAAALFRLSDAFSVESGQYVINAGRSAE